MSKQDDVKAHHDALLAALDPETAAVVRREVKIHALATSMNQVGKAVPDYDEAVKKARTWVFDDVVESQKQTAAT